MIAIRPAKPCEAERVAAIYVRAARHAYRPFMPAAVSATFTMQQQRSTWSHRMSPAKRGFQFLIADVDGEPKGFVGLGPATPQPSDDRSVGEVHWLFVLPEFARRGVGTALLTHAGYALHAAGYDSAVLWVFSANHAARSFYESAGWQPVLG
ncbi:MAG: GNAT family N-acetyltransferase, partial [Mycobacteriales bacterium]